MDKEREQSSLAGEGEPFNPSPLPPDLADFLRDREYACITQSTDHGTVFVVKLPERDFSTLPGNVPIRVVHELHRHRQAPVIRIVTRIYDQPQHPLAFETFINVEDEQQRADYAALANQDELYMLFYDGEDRHRLTKAVPSVDRDVAMGILARADVIFAAIPRERFDFDRAKADVIARTRL